MIDYRYRNERKTLMCKVLFLVIALLVVTPVHPADVNGDGAETILFPFAFLAPDQEIPGARGTLWGGEVWFENRNSDHVRVWAECYATTTCIGSTLGTGDGRRVFSPPQFGIDPQVGFRFVVGLAQAKNLTFSSRIFERTLRAQPRGVDIPVVREGAFFTGTQTFLGVPAGSGVRTSLRIYDPWAGLHIDDASGFRPAFDPQLQKVVVEVYAFPSGELFEQVELRPVLVGANGTVEDDNRVGFAAIYDLAALFPGVLAAERIHISVRPFPDGAQYWGMVAVTDNETQTVSIITAQ